MKYEIYTIPVIDSFNNAKCCPFCHMFQILNSAAVDFMLGDSYMEDDIRMKTNEQGFCREHYKQMLERQNALGVALMMHTHIQEINKNLSNPQKQKKGAFGRLGKKPEENQTAAYLTKTLSECYVCDRIENTLGRYFDTTLYLWRKNNEFKQIFKNTKGFCLDHFAKLLTEAEKLPAKDYDEFLNTLMPIQQNYFKRLEDNLDWFIKKNDYRFKDEPWKDAKDAVWRGLEGLASLELD